MKNSLVKVVAIAALIVVLLAIYSGIRHFQRQLPDPVKPASVASKPIDKPLPNANVTDKPVDVKFVDGKQEISFRQIPLFTKNSNGISVDGDIMKALIEKLPDRPDQPVPSQLKKAATGNFDRLLRGNEIEKIDRQKTLAQLEKAINEQLGSASLTVELQTSFSEGPESFNQKRKEMGFKTLIASFTTLHEGHIDDEGRNVNLKIAAEKIDGLIIPPGGKFSFNKVVGPRTEKCGFKKAGVISQGKVIPGLGGGICQVS